MIRVLLLLLAATGPFCNVARASTLVVPTAADVSSVTDAAEAAAEENPAVTEAAAPEATVAPDADAETETEVATIMPGDSDAITDAPGIADEAPATTPEVPVGAPEAPTAEPEAPAAETEAPARVNEETPTPGDQTPSEATNESQPEETDIIKSVVGHEVESAPPEEEGIVVEDGYSSGMLVGIVIGALIAVAVVIAVVVVVVRRMGQYSP
ncbi:podoplanin isoform X2 [Denticeps clupeoides]|uniref:podoplanin isoform X2 n=1 Tax=Denticeps clupeoides TaxID=299321 RepID=UPI0010A533A1|nr:podoplanin isoform X2 [Denticeps clupeoides]